MDEAHLICEWQSFRGNYGGLETIKEHFSTTPVMFLTAMATPSMAEKLKGCLHDPCVLKGTINRPNIILDVQVLEYDKGHVSKDNQGDYSGFATKVSKIISKDSAIVYTDFIAEIAPTTQALAIKWGLPLPTIMESWILEPSLHHIGIGPMAKCR